MNETSEVLGKRPEVQQRGEDFGSLCVNYEKNYRSNISQPGRRDAGKP